MDTCNFNNNHSYIIILVILICGMCKKNSNRFFILILVLLWHKTIISLCESNTRQIFKLSYKSQNYFKTLLSPTTVKCGGLVITIRRIKDKLCDFSSFLSTLSVVIFWNTFKVLLYNFTAYAKISNVLNGTRC